MRIAGRVTSLAALGCAAALTVAACAATAPASRPPTSASAYAIAPTPWPNGTVGPYGLRVDPALLALLPRSAGGLPLTESVLDELGPLGDRDLAASAEALAAARAGMTGDADWVAVSVVRLRPEAATRDFFEQMAADYRTAACQPAGGIASTTTTELADRSVEVAVCSGGVGVYAVELDNRVVLFATEMGTRHIGRELIAAIP